MQAIQQLYLTLYERIDPWLLQVPEQEKDRIFQDMVNDIKNGYALALEKNGVVFYFVPENEWLYRMHLFSKAENISLAIEGGKHLTNRVFDLMPKLQKIYGITPLKSLVRVSEKFGWKHEGTLKESFMTKDGTLKDQYVFGVSRNENNTWRNKYV